MVLAGLAGCSAAGGPNSTGSGCDTPAPGVTPDEVKIGFVISDRGISANVFQPARSAVEARIGVANEAGGVHGRKIVYEWRDDQSDAGINLQAARDLVESQNVFGILEMTGVAVGSAAYLNEHAVPVVGRAIEPVWSDYRNMFSYANLVPSTAVDTFGIFAKSLGGSRAAILSAHVVPASRAAGNLFAQSLTAAGIEVVADIDYTPGTISPDRVARQIRESGADTLMAALGPEDFATVYAAAQEAGAQLLALTPMGYDRNVLQTFGPKLAGVYIFLSLQPFELETPAHQAYRDAMARYAPELQPPEQEAALGTYITTDLLLRGLEEAGPCPTREAFIANLRAVDDFDGGGLMAGSVDLEAGFGQPSRCYTFVRVNPAGSAFEAVTDTPVCGNLL